MSPTRKRLPCWQIKTGEYLYPSYAQRDPDPGRSRGLIYAVPGEVDLDRFDMSEMWAYITWSGDSVVECLNVLPEHQRKGIATHLFALAQTICRGLRHSDNLTPDAEKWVAGMETKKA